MKVIAKDLMIGDWVIVHARTDRTAKIEAIDLHGVKTSIGGPWMIDEIDPIPLTPEILERNGFKLISDPGWKQEYMWSTGRVEEYADVYIIVGSDHGGKLGWDFPLLHIRQYKGEIILHKFRYVHELQHALRLCGIEKEIEL